MGYSCSQDAAHTLGVIRMNFKGPDGNNVLRLKGQDYFFERGKEQPDGAITGTLYRMLPNDLARKAGSVKISADGEVVRFPALTPRQKQAAYKTMIDLRGKNPSLLRSWSLGVF